MTVKRLICASAVLILATVARAFAGEPGPVKNGVVYREAGRFAGWPANNGIWSWGDEIVVGFTLGYYADNPKGGHPIDRNRTSQPMLARSLDGGETWKIETPSYLSPDHKKPGNPSELANVDFMHPDFALMNRMAGSNHGQSCFYWSNDRCKTWHGPYDLPLFGRKGIMARTDYIVGGKQEMLSFLTAEKTGGGEGYPFCARTTDGGQTWKLESWIGDEPGPGGYAIMPSTVRISDKELFTYIRCRGGQAGSRSYWIEPYRSTDDGKSWKIEKENTINNGGNPPHMLKLKDGRIALTFGTRVKPYGVRARLSGDGGRTWTKDIVIRDDGGVWDLGYVRTALRPDGKILAAYYFNDPGQKERYIAYTIWDPK